MVGGSCFGVGALAARVYALPEKRGVGLPRPHFKQRDNATQASRQLGATSQPLPR